MVPTELLVVMLVEQVGETPTVAALAAEQVTAHSSSGLALVLAVSETVAHQMLVAMAPERAAAKVVSWVRPHLGARSLA